MKFVDLFAGLGGFHLALTRLGMECVFASEIDDELRDLYALNFPHMRGKVFGDIKQWKGKVPKHDILCAGFPCQPFSKSGEQLGTKDDTRGTLFHEVLDILSLRRPRFVLMENVGNFARHDKGRTWRIVRDSLRRLGYHVSGTEHKTPQNLSDWRDVGSPNASANWLKEIGDELQLGGHGLISPHHFGYPQHRERFYIVASLDPLHDSPFPAPAIDRCIFLKDIVQSSKELTVQDIQESALSTQQISCIAHWNKLIQRLPASIEPPSFPLWGDELGARYPFKIKTPWASTPAILGASLNPPAPKYTRKALLLSQLPSYAREETPTFRQWKIRYIEQNRDWWARTTPYIPHGWGEKLAKYPSSLRKLEWNVKGGTRDLWCYVLQFRPSGLRVKRYTNSPALVAMTTTQIPILGPERRFLTRTEGLRLQGFPDNHRLPKSRVLAFKALGNAVHVEIVKRLTKHLTSPAIDDSDLQRTNSAREFNRASASI